MSNKIFRVIENFYRSAYGQHRFLLNHIGVEFQLYKPNPGILNPEKPNPINILEYPSPSEILDIYDKTYGPGFNMTSIYSPVGSVRLLTKLYSLSNITEETSELGDVTAYDYSGQVDLGDQLMTTIGHKNITFKVTTKKAIGFGKHIVYELILKPIVLLNQNVQV